MMGYEPKKKVVEKIGESSTRMAALFKLFERTPRNKTCDDSVTVPETVVSSIAPTRQQLHDQQLDDCTTRTSGSAPPSFQAASVGTGVSDVADYNLEDMFSRGLNHCTPESLPSLRQYRSKVAPIVAYESDEELDNHIKARLEALEVQQELLGADHSDVLFLQKRVCRHAVRRGRGDFVSRYMTAPMEFPREG
jgi:hypothetical protein